jgi:PHD/YefM family antitoxin component YafN of YafNO toxin-antitoxin module
MAANDAEIPTVDDVRRDPAAVLTRFRDESSFAFSFGDDGKPEAVLLTFDEYEDLGGLDKFTAPGDPLTPDAISLQLPAIVESIRAGSFTAPILWSDSTEPAAVIMSPQQYRHLRGDDEPPAGQVDDPTTRTYNTKPLSTSRAMTVEEFAEWLGPEAVKDLEEIKREPRDG